MKNIKNNIKNYILPILIIISILTINIGIANADSNGIWTDAKDIRAGTFASDEIGGEFTFDDTLNINGNLNVDSGVKIQDLIVDNSITINGGENSLKLNPGILPNQHSFISFYKDTNNEAKKYYIGIPNSASKDFVISHIGMDGGKIDLQSEVRISQNLKVEKEIYEGLNKLSEKYLGLHATADKSLDSNLLEGHNSAYFQREIGSDCPINQYIFGINDDGTLDCRVDKTIPDTNTWDENTKTIDGYVTAPGAIAYKVWKTDANGNPGWNIDWDMQLDESQVDNFVSNNGYLTVENDPKVGTLTSGKWCRNDGAKIICDVNSIIDTTIADTNAKTLCGSGKLLDGDGNCINIPIADTNAKTLCGSGKLLDGDGNCINIPVNTNTQLTESQVDTYVSNNGYSTTFTEVDGSITNELQNLDSVLSKGTSAGSQKITSLANPTSAQDAATKYYVDNINDFIIQCPPLRTIVDENSKSWDEWQQYSSCTIGKDSNKAYVTLKKPEICDNGNCYYIRNGYNNRRDKYCEAYGLKGYDSTTTSAGVKAYVLEDDGRWGLNTAGGGYFGEFKCSK